MTKISHGPSPENSNRLPDVHVYPDTGSIDLFGRFITPDQAEELGNSLIEAAALSRAVRGGIIGWTLVRTADR